MLRTVLLKFWDMCEYSRHGVIMAIAIGTAFVFRHTPALDSCVLKRDIFVRVCLYGGQFFFGCDCVLLTSSTLDTNSVSE
jgi:hypothetical protein